MACGRLRNLSFEYVRARILSIEYITRVLVEWKLNSTTQKLSSLFFFIDRSEGADEWIQLNGEPISAVDLHEFVDYTAQLYDLQKSYLYRVRAVEYFEDDPVQTFTSAAVNANESGPDLTALYITEEHLYKYRWVTGVPCFLYKKRHDGGYCPDCWDEVLKRVTRSNCRTCFGSGKVEGYYPPIDSWIEFGVRTEVAQVQQQGVVQPDKTTAEMTNHPILRIGDLIQEVRARYIWRVSNIVQPEKSRMNMLQQFQLSAVNRSDIEYKLPFPEDRARTLVDEYESRLKEPEY